MTAGVLEGKKDTRKGEILVRAEVDYPTMELDFNLSVLP